MARFSVAAGFWQQGQTKVQGFAVNFINSTYPLAWRRLADGVIDLFESEYKLLLLPAELGATMAALGEHVFPVCISLCLGKCFFFLKKQSRSCSALIFASKQGGLNRSHAAFLRHHKSKALPKRNSRLEFEVLGLCRRPCRQGDVLGHDMVIAKLAPGILARSNARGLSVL